MELGLRKSGGGQKRQAMSRARFIRRFKDALDPKGVLNPGKFSGLRLSADADNPSPSPLPLRKGEATRDERGTPNLPKDRSAVADAERRTSSVRFWKLEL
jgi:hypothetical protein